jgi:hypothetical protein
MLDPARAPRRDDLPWLRHRSRPRAGAASPNGGGIRYVHDRPRHRPAAPPAAAGAGAAALDLDRPSAPAPLNLPRPAPASLDLDRPARPASLDLDESPAARPAPRQPTATARRARIVRVSPRDRRILTADEPTVTLTRLQSGIGTLQVEAATPATGDLQIGALLELADGTSTTVDLAAGRRSAPRQQRSPVLVARRERFEQLVVDLRRTRELRRLAVYGVAASRQPLHWSGTLVVTTFGGGRVDIPLESLPSCGTAVLLSAYNVDGEFVLRTELAPVDGGLREAARAYGYDRISWLDDRNPVD